MKGFTEYLLNISGIDIYAIASMLIFITLFVGLGIWVSRKDARYIDEMKNLPISSN